MRRSRFPHPRPRDARSGLAAEAAATAVRIARQSAPEADCRIALCVQTFGVCRSCVGIENAARSECLSRWVKSARPRFEFHRYCDVFCDGDSEWIVYWPADDTRECGWSSEWCWKMHFKESFAMSDRPSERGRRNSRCKGGCPLAVTAASRLRSWTTTHHHIVPTTMRGLRAYIFPLPTYPNYYIFTYALPFVVLGSIIQINVDL